MTEPLLLIHAAATWFMIGLIWFVQIVHYPLFGAIGSEQWIEYESHHKVRTTFVVLPIMFAELLSGSLIAMGIATDAPPGALAWIGVGLLAIVWISTFGVQVPLHERLSREHSDGAIRRLVCTNWIRTIAWSARGIVAILLLS